MIEDELLKWRFKCGSQDALRRIYEKYLNHLLTLAMALLGDVNTAQDVVHDVFVAFAKSSEDFKLQGSLRSYLATCVLNRARDRIRSNQRNAVGPVEPSIKESETGGPEQLVIASEESQRLNYAIGRLPPEQREAVVLHIKSQMKFKEIAKLQGVSVSTAVGRYRYALNKLRSILDGEVEK